MLKPDSLRNALINAVPALRDHPDTLRLYVASGNVAATLAPSLSFEKQYRLTVAISEFAGDIDLLLVPVMAWLRENQPDVMATDEGCKSGFTFTADINEGRSLNVTMNVQLTERTLVKEGEAGLYAENLPEPRAPEPVTRPMALYINGELVSQWRE
ncbi:phage tail protein [Enterobacter sp.]|uniref:phage tail protein n=1 Tax=Enterobacter sp. TaxID=42895 RepID=UPI00298132C0|nr:phage tail protein [Enterobacter sp.]